MPLLIVDKLYAFVFVCSKELTKIKRTSSVIIQVRIHCYQVGSFYLLSKSTGVIFGLQLSISRSL